MNDLKKRKILVVDDEITVCKSIRQAILSDEYAVDMALSGAMLGAVIVLAVSGVAASANLQGVFPALLESVYKSLPIYGGVFVGVTAICAVVGLFLGKRGAR